MRGYWFSGDKLRDGRDIPPIGEWLEHEGPVVPCKSGLHMSEHPFDALQYATGGYLHTVDLEGDLVPHGDPTDKWVGRRRRRNSTIDATDLLYAFARWCALQVIHLWDAPPVVRTFLETGDESLRAVARAASSDAAWVAERSTSRAASGDPVWSVVWAAAASRVAGQAKQRDKFAELVDAAFVGHVKKGE